MSTQSPTESPRQGRDPYQLVTDIILGHLEMGTVPWRRPWNNKVGKPRNFLTGKAYQGINLILLGFRRFASPYWLTLRQANAVGGNVRKGEHGSFVVKYGKYEAKQDTPDGNDSGEQKPAYYLKEYVVFNSLQIEGITFPEVVQVQPMPDATRFQISERIVSSMPDKPQIHIGKSVEALYRRSTDTVEMPATERFTSAENFHLALFHELTHSTGSEKRLNRKTLLESDGLGGKVYSKEELVAEMGAAFLGMEADIVADDHEQSAAYLQSWLQALREPDHKRWIIEAASQATKAVQFILGNQQPAQVVAA
jgi:antirestriction protein ArdC